MEKLTNVVHSWNSCLGTLALLSAWKVEKEMTAKCGANSLSLGGPRTITYSTIDVISLKRRMTYINYAINSFGSPWWKNLYDIFNTVDTMR